MSLARSSGPHQGLHPRTSSPVIARFPWQTRNVFQNRVLGSHEEETSNFKTFFRDLEMFEKRMFSQALDKQLFEYRRAIHVHEPEYDMTKAVVPYSRPDLDERLAPATCAILALYRLAEVPDILRGIQPSDRILHPRSFLQKPKLGVWNRLDDWPSLVLRAKVMVDKKLQASVSSSSSLQLSDSQDAHLLQILSQLTAQDHVTKMTLNVVVASLYLSRLLKPKEGGGSPLNDSLEALSDLPSLSALLSTDESAHLDNDELKIFAHTDLLSPHHAILPLLIALLISPICLLLASKLVQKNTWSRQDLFQTAWALGNGKPDVLLRSEQPLWDLLIRLALEKMPLDAIVLAIKTTLAQLPVDELQNLPTDDPVRFWFQPGPGVTMNLGNPLNEAPVNTSMTWTGGNGDSSTPSTLQAHLRVSNRLHGVAGEHSTTGHFVDKTSPTSHRDSGTTMTPDQDIDPGHPGQGGMDGDQEGTENRLPGEEENGRCLTEERQPPEVEINDGFRDMAKQPMLAATADDQVLPKTNEPKGSNDLEIGMDLDAGTVEGQPLVGEKDDRSQSGAENDAPGEEDALGSMAEQPTLTLAAAADQGLSKANEPKGSDAPEVDMDIDAGRMEEQLPAGDKDDQSRFGAEEDTLGEDGDSDDNACTAGEDGRDDFVGPGDEGTSAGDQQRDESPDREDTQDETEEEELSGMEDEEGSVEDGLGDKSTEEPSDRTSGRGKRQKNITRPNYREEDSEDEEQGVKPHKGRQSERKRKRKRDQTDQDGFPNAKKPNVEKKTTPKPSRDRSITDMLENDTGILNASSIDYEVHPIAQSEYWTPFTIDPFEAKKSVTLDISSTPPIFEGAETLAYGPAEGNVLSFVPRFHDQKLLKTFETFQKAIKAGFVNGGPPHLTDPEHSVFKIMTESEFLSASVQTIQEILRKQCIVVTERTGRPLNFNADGLRTLGALHKVVPVQDWSIVDVENGNARRKEGTMYMIYECSQKMQHKILNALQFPRAQAGYEYDLSAHLSTDGCAWTSTEGAVDCKEGLELPVSDMRWGLLALNGAIHLIHIDSDGFGTFIDPKTGAKYWIILKPKKNYNLSKNAFFFAEDFDIDSPNMFDVEAILIQPGTTLIMPPNTPHAVYTPQHAICWGGHFYATSTMQTTLYGIVHAFMAGKYITNTSHQASRLLLRRIICFYYQALVEGAVMETDPLYQHVPDLQSIDSALDLLSICTLMYLGNALDFQTYTFPGREDGEALTDAEKTIWFQDDLNSMPKVDRKRCTYARGIARVLLSWFANNYSISFNPSAESTVGWKPLPVKSFALTFIAEQLVAIKAYKRSAFEREHKSSELASCTYDMFAHQVDGCFDLHDPLRLYKEAAEAAHLKHPFTSMGFTDKKGCYRIEKVQRPTLRRKDLPYNEIDRLGRSQRDKDYYTYLEAKETAQWVKMEDIQ